MGLIELKEDNEFYLVAPAMAVELEGEYSHYTLYTVVTRQGVVRLWPVRLAGPDGKSNTWWDSAHEAADIHVGMDAPHRQQVARGVRD